MSHVNIELSLLYGPEFSEVVTCDGLVAVYLGSVFVQCILAENARAKPRAALSTDGSLQSSLICQEIAALRPDEVALLLAVLDSKPFEASLQMSQDCARHAGKAPSDFLDLRSSQDEDNGPTALASQSFPQVAPGDIPEVGAASIVRTNHIPWHRLIRVQDRLEASLIVRLASRRRQEISPIGTALASVLNPLVEGKDRKGHRAAVFASLKMYPLYHLVWKTIAALEAVLEALASHAPEYTFLLLERQVCRLFSQDSPQALACVLCCFSLPHAPGFKAGLPCHLELRSQKLTGHATWSLAKTKGALPRGAQEALLRSKKKVARPPGAQKA